MRIRSLLLSLSFLLASLAASAGTFIVPDDDVLIRRAKGIVTGTVLESQSHITPEGGVRTVTQLWIDRVLAGPLQPGQLVAIVEPGGVTPSLSLLLHGVPHFNAGERVLVFLDTNVRGDLTALDFALGKFSFAKSESGKEYLLREEGNICGWAPGHKPYKEKARRADGFLQHIADVTMGTSSHADYSEDYTEVCTSDGQNLTVSPEAASDYSFCSCRWSIFTPPTSTISFLTSGTQTGITDSLGAVDAGTAAWTNDAGSTIQYQRGGTTAVTQGFNTFDGIHAVIFNDPSGEISGSFTGSGTLAVGGPWFGGSHSFDGSTFSTVSSADVVVQDGVSNATGITQAEFEAVLAHELGHTLGFRHSAEGTPSAANALMAALLNNGPGTASLLQWDIDAAAAMYGGCSAVSISSHPASTSISYNTSTTLSVTASGSAPFTYQWYTGDSGDETNAIGGATSSSLDTGALTATTSYWVKVTNCSDANSANSNTATVTVVCNVSITAHPQSTSVPTGGSTNLSVTVSPASGTYSYQWYRGSSGDTSSQVGTNSSTLNTGAINSDTNFWVRVTRTDCATTAADSNTATVYACNTPTVDDFAPTSAPVGASVIITGTNLGGTTAVRFNGLTASFTVDSPTQVTATVPVGATNGTISIATTPMCSATSAGSFSVILPPTVSSFTPSMGCIGTNVSINGTNFSSATAVKFNGVDANSFTINGPTSITAVAPSALSAGKISVTNPAGSAQSVANFNLSSGCLLAVTSLTATPISASQINLAWTYTGTGNTGYRIERKIGTGGSWTQITQTSTPSTKTFSNTALTNCTEYYYRVRAYTASGNGAFSNEATASTPGCLETPTDLVATPASTTSIGLTWNYGGAGHTGFKIERRLASSATWAQIAMTTTPSTTSFTSTSLALCTEYVYRVRAWVGTASSSYTNESGATTQGCLETPASLVATPVSATQISLAWSYGGTGHSGFKIERRLASSATWTQIAQTTTPATLTFANTALMGCTDYVYRVRSYRLTPAGNSLYSNESAASTTGCIAAPDTLTATPISMSQINLAWNYAGTGHTGFKVERRLASSVTWTQVAQIASAASRSFNSTALVACTEYVFRVRAYTATPAVNSAFSNEANATTTGCLEIPASLVATPLSATQISLTWSYGGTGHSGFKIERRLASSATWTQIAQTTTPATLSFTSSSLAGCTEYVYRVRSYRASPVGNSAYSNESSATTTGCIAAPDTLTATPISLSQINLAWNYAGSGHTGFKIERRLASSATWTQIAQVASAAARSFNSTALVACTEYVYRVRAYTATPAVNSAYTNEANATTTGCLETPTSLVATPLSATQISLTWSYGGTGHSGFKIERRLASSATWTQIAQTTTPGTLSFTSSSLAGCTEYVYRVRSYRASPVGNSAYSNESNATTTGCLVTPTNLVATPVSNTQINLTWDFAGSGHTGFRIERRLASAVTWTQIASTTTPGTTAFSNLALLACNSYVYRVRAYTSTPAVNSAYTNEAGATTTGCLPTPTSLVATPVSNTRIDLTWSYAGGGHSGFKIERRIRGNAMWTLIASTTTPGVTTYMNNTGLVVCTEYEYRVRAYMGTTGTSLNSNEATAATNGCITAPASLVATPLSTTSIQLTWSYAGSGHSGFKIERRAVTGTTWMQVAMTTTPGTLTFTNSSLMACTQYLYRVRAYTSTTANSLFSNEANATTTCP